MGLLDGIPTFDIEIARLSRGGVYRVANQRKLPTSTSTSTLGGCYSL